MNYVFVENSEYTVRFSELFLMRVLFAINVAKDKNFLSYLIKYWNLIHIYIVNVERLMQKYI